MTSTLASESARADDAHARRLAVTEFARPLLLIAGAGSGKTSTLISRVLAWALGPGWLKHVADNSDPGLGAERLLRRVTAVTFTDRAAGEMRERLRRELLALASGAPVPGLDGNLLGLAPEELRRRAAVLALAAPAFAASTIHAWCRALLMRYPLEAGLPPNFEVDADGESLRAVVDRAVRHAATEGLGDTPDEAWVKLASEGVSIADVVRAVELLLRERVLDSELATDNFSPAALKEQVEAWLPAVAQSARRFLAAVGSLRKNDRAHRCAEELARLHSELGAVRSFAELTETCARQEALQQSPCFDKLSAGARAAIGGEDPAAARDDFDLVRVRLAHGAGQDEAYFRAAQAVTGPILALVRSAAGRRGIVTFSDLLAHAHALLRGQASVRARVQAEIDQLLVDEFQDTDPLQYDLIRALAFDGGDAPGLFLVGDPKQSIYGWRQADLLALDTFAAELKARGGICLDLVVNFRSVPAILAEVARVVEPVMVEVAGVQPVFAPLLVSDAGRARAAAAPPEVPAIRYWMPWSTVNERGGRATPARVSREIEARAIAHEVTDLRARGFQFRDLAILFRSTGEQEIYADALRAEGVPFSLDERTSFFARREVRDLCALMRTLLDPTDLLALAGFLRSPLVGVPDSALEPLWRRGLPRLLFAAGCALALDRDRLAQVIAESEAEVQADPLGGTSPRFGASLHQAILDVAELRERVRTESAEVWIPEVHRRFRPLEVAAGRTLGEHRLSLVSAFFRELRAQFARSITIRELLVWLHGEDLESALKREPTVGGGGADAVALLTIHKAKGLDWRVVIVADLGHAMRRSVHTDHEVLRGREGRIGLRLFAADGGYLAPLRLAARARQRAEEVRALYVAMTRAKDHLLMVGRSPRTATSDDGVPALFEFLPERAGGWPDWETRWTSDDFMWRDEHAVEFGFPAKFENAEGGQSSAPKAAVAIDDLVARAILVETHGWQPLLRERIPRFVAASAGETASQSLEGDDSPEDALRERHLRIDTPASAGEFTRSRSMARAVGTAVHLALELWDPTDAPEAAKAQGAAHAESSLRAQLPESEVRGAVREALDCLRNFFDGAEAARIRKGESRIVGREIPMLLRAQPGEAALVAFRGTIDLLIEDAASGDLIVVDYKTDRGDGRAASADGRADSPSDPHQGQADIYRRAVAAQYPGRRVRSELWFL